MGAKVNSDNYAPALMSLSRKSFDNLQVFHKAINQSAFAWAMR